jgi:hypothetical protein
MRHFTLVSALVLMALMGGCIQRVAPGCDLDTPYDIAIQRWTARADLFDPLTERAIFTATVESRIFREQRVRERARELGWTAETEAAELTKESQAGEAETSFIIGAYTDRPRDNNLADSTSTWRIALESPGGELLPIKVEALGRFLNPNLHALYPQLDIFSRVYRIHFAHVPEGPVTLRLASGIGLADMKFERL